MEPRETRRWTLITVRRSVDAPEDVVVDGPALAPRECVGVVEASALLAALDELDALKGENARLQAGLEKVVEMTTAEGEHGECEIMSGGLTARLVLDGSTRPLERYTEQIATLRAELATLRERAGSTIDSPTWPYVLAFAKAMESKLAANRHKGDREGWMAMRSDDLLDRMADERVELRSAIANDEGKDAILSEAADVANFAMMVADRNGALAPGFLDAKEGGR